MEGRDYFLFFGWGDEFVDEGEFYCGLFMMDVFGCGGGDDWCGWGDEMWLSFRWGGCLIDYFEVVFGL